MTVPPPAICIFKEGSAWCCTFGDFVNLQESPAGFGDTLYDAVSNLGGAAGTLPGPRLRALTDCLEAIHPQRYPVDALVASSLRTLPDFEFEHDRANRRARERELTEDTRAKVRETREANDREVE